MPTWNDDIFVNTHHAVAMPSAPDTQPPNAAPAHLFRRGDANAPGDRLVVFTPLCLRVALHNAFSACRLDDVQLCVDRGARNPRPVPVLELGSWTGLSHQRSPQARAWSGATRTRAKE
jgi:hypothetical protein